MKFRMKPTLKGLTCVVLTILVTPSTADEALFKHDRLDETLVPEANTGGARVMGLQIPGGSAYSDLQVLMPPGWSSGSLFCVRTGTSDGLYDSENTYTAPNDLSEPVDVPHMSLSRYADELSDVHPEGLGIRVLRAECSAVTNQTPSALALWRDAEPGDRFVMFVNSFDADRLVAFPPHGDAVECEPIAADISVAFDRRCEIPLPVDMKEFSVDLQPIKGGRRGRTETIVIELR